MYVRTNVKLDCTCSNIYLSIYLSIYIYIYVYLYVLVCQCIITYESEVWNRGMEWILQTGMERGYGTGVWNGGMERVWSRNLFRTFHLTCTHMRNPKHSVCCDKLAHIAATKSLDLHLQVATELPPREQRTSRGSSSARKPNLTNVPILIIC